MNSAELGRRSPKGCPARREVSKRRRRIPEEQRIRRIERAGRILRLHVRSDAAGVAHELASFEPRTVDVLDLGLEDIFLGAVSDDAAYSSAKDRA